MRNFIKVASVPVATVAMTGLAYAGGGGGGADVGEIGMIMRAITHIVAQLSSMF